MHYYKLILPDGKTWRLEIGTLDERKKVAEDLIEKWKPYCLNGWDKDDGDVYSPANKVKRFLNSLAYYLLFDDTEGIVTDYKEQVTGKREIPISSCPEIEDAVYSSSSPPQKNSDQDWSLRQYPEEEKKTSTRKKIPKKETRWDRIQSFRKRYPHAGPSKPHPVDTENKFVCEDHVYQIDIVAAPQYSANSDGVYGMDKVWSSMTSDGLLFFDQDFKKLSPEAVQKIR